MSTDHRKIAVPPWFYPRRRNICCWCNQPIAEKRKWVARYWHKKCVDEYNELQRLAEANNPRVLEASDGICAACGAPLEIFCRVPWLRSPPWEPCSFKGKYGRGLPSPTWRTEVWWEDDHIIPLVEALPHADDPWWAHRLSNRQALCPPCHRAKTAREATRRAEARRRFQANRQGLLFPEAA